MARIPVHRFPPRYGARPRLRPVQTREVDASGRRAYVVHAPDRPENEGLLLPAEALAVASYFDGRRDLRAVQRAIREDHGQLVYVERIDEVARVLFRQGLVEAAPLAVPARGLRPASHAGASYDSEPEKLRAFLDGLFTGPDGPGRPDPARGGSPVLGIVAPHIDPPRGSATYAHAYATLAGRTTADLFVVLGTAHATPPSLVSITPADYDTPLGPVPTDVDALAVFESELGDAIYRDEAVHATEHSVEFQALMLRHMFPDRAITMLPVLCSSLYTVATRGERPGDDSEVQAFLTALAHATEGRNVCYVAAADLSHVGPAYGDLSAPGEAELRVLEQRDRESLSFLERGDPEGFFDHVAPDADQRRICGLAPIYLVMRALGGAPMKLLRYALWQDEADGNVVTFAAGVVENPDSAETAVTMPPRS